MAVVDPNSFGPFSDATLTSLSWESDGRDFVIELVQPNSLTERFLFTWVDHLKICVFQNENGPSQPFAWQGKAVQLSSGRVRVVLDFASHGEISLECNNIMLGGT